MAEDSLRDLSFGHLGQAVFDTKSRLWSFARFPKAGKIRSVGEHEDLIGPQRSVDGAAKIDRKTSRDLAYTYPELTIVSGAVINELRLSAAVSAAEVQYDATKSDLIAFGEITSGTPHRPSRDVTPTLAVASGPVGEWLRLMQFSYQRQGWAGDSSTWLNVPQFKAGEEARWDGIGSSILQVVFSERSQGLFSGSLLAVRTRMKTVIFRPLHVRAAARAQVRPAINPNPWISISVEESGGLLHMDVTFNPWFPQQFALIDTEGHFTIWDLEFTNRSASRASKSRSSQVFEDPKSHDLGDGWARISWLTDVNTLAACTRRHLAFFDLSSVPPTRIQSPDLRLENTPDWVLDMKRSPSDPKYLFLLTSSHIHWVEAGKSPQAVSQMGDLPLSVRMCLSVRHFRDSEDISLRLELVSLDQEMLLMVHSRVNDLVSTWRALLPIHSASVHFSMSNVSYLPFDNEYTGGPPPSTARNGERDSLKAIPISYGSKGLVDYESLGRQYMESGVYFIKATTLGKNLSLRMRTYVVQTLRSTQTGTRGTLLEHAVLPSRMIKLPTHTQTWRSNATVEDDFIVDDSQMSSGEDEQTTHTQRDLTGSIASRTRKARTIDLQWLEKSFSLLQKVDLRTRDKSILEELKDSIGQKVEIKDGSIETLSDLIRRVSSSVDIDKFSSEMESFLRSHATKNDEIRLKAEYNRLARRETFGLPASNREQVASESPFLGFTLSELYDHLISLWLAPLPRHVPGKLRVALERVIRSTAYQLYLSSIGVTLEQRTTMSRTSDEIAVLTTDAVGAISKGGQKLLDGHLDTTEVNAGAERAQPPPLSPNTDELPSSQPALYSSQPSTEASSSYQLPSPAPTRSSASQNGAENPSSLPEDASGEFSALKKYAQLKNAPVVLPKASDILRHWKIGTDPKHYSYSAPSRAVESQSDESDVDVAADDDDPESFLAQTFGPQRSKSRSRSRSRQNAKVSRTKQNRQDMPASASQPPMATSRSLNLPTRSKQPGEGMSSLTLGTQKSQDTARAPATQPERGRFGGQSREQKRKKVKRAGF